MSQKISSNPVGRRYAGAETMPLDSTPSPNDAAHLVASLVGTLPVKPSALAHVAKIAGRKQLAHDLRISKSLLDQMIAGEKHDPIERTRRLVRVAVKYCGADMALTIAHDLASEIGGVVLSAAEFALIKQIWEKKS